VILERLRRLALPYLDTDLQQIAKKVNILFLLAIMLIQLLRRKNPTSNQPVANDRCDELSKQNKLYDGVKIGKW